MDFTGNLRKMHAELHVPVQYKLPVGTQLVPLNQLLGSKISIQYKGIINCIKCGRQSKTSFAQGYCYPCFISAPETEDCVLRPELCQAHEGIARDMAYAREHCLIEHVVYIALTSGLKVGVTRNTQVPVRWTDQGAVQVIELARTPDRFTAGVIEVAMKSHFNDKTNWRKMLSDVSFEDISLTEVKSEAYDNLPDDLKHYYSENSQVLNINYPVNEYPEKIKSLNLDKTPGIEGILTGIKGQYLMFDRDRVINIRKFGGYLVRVEV